MSFKNTESRYGSVSKFFHWGMAVIVIGLLAAGIIMGDLEKGPLQSQVYALHKSFGISVLALVICRLCWNYINQRPQALATAKAWEKKLAKGLYGVLYLLMILMPLTGWLMSSFKTYSVSVFGVVTLPDLVAPDKELGSLFREFHEILGWTMTGIVGLHILAALKHHFVDKDETLRRMLPHGTGNKGE
jgi:cytochrome b561